MLEALDYVDCHQKIYEQHRFFAASLDNLRLTR
jgi:hypothetical protein